MSEILFFHKSLRNVAIGMSLLLSSIYGIQGAKASDNKPDYMVLGTDPTAISTLYGEYAKYEVVTPIPQCPKNMMCEIHSRLHITFKMKGCADKLGPVSVSRQDAVKGILKFNVLATNIHFEMSDRTDCREMPTKTIVIPLGFGIFSTKNVQVEFQTEINPFEVAE